MSIIPDLPGPTGCHRNYCKSCVSLLPRLGVVELEVEPFDLTVAWLVYGEKGPVDADCRAMSSLSPVPSQRNSN
ncbi:hypothetical protein KOW79_013345 [Hemibagrus wyckioides]|uniref:Uncharacterized protein n=1 Tax=Hemibagrus wyckioides TaxID=337641 RepID=A0A9D3SLA2_9TELE|nr:hypothetical protein KOW79_013345 [Hemibagrus wyckioides]